MSRRFATIAVVTALLIGTAGCSGDDGAAATLDRFLAGWPTGELAQVRFVTPAGAPVPGEQVAEAIATLAGDLALAAEDAAAGDATAAGTAEADAAEDRDGAGAPELAVAQLQETDGDATATLDIGWPLPGGARWGYQSQVRLSEDDQGWRVIWEPAVVHPQLRDGDQLRLRRQLAPRAAILDGDGEPLVTTQPVRSVGVWPSQVADLDTLTDTLDAALRSLGHQLDFSDLAERVEAATEADLFVAVVTLRESEYQQVADDLADLPGITTQTSERALAPTRTFARALLGTLGEVFAEDVAAQPGLYQPGDLIGRGGLQQRYEQRLRGTLGYAVVIERPSPGGQPTETELSQIDPQPGAPLATTLDQPVQIAAEQALAAEDRPAALVAIRVSDGAVLAVANTVGAEANPVNLALTGSVPPGSTFKLVSAYRLLDTGALTLDTPVPCPARHSVEGFAITNAFSGDRGELPFAEAVAISCNTAFAELAPQLGDGGLAEAAATLGIGADWDLGVETFTGSVPAGGSALQRAVAAFGQGETLVSPAAMAAATAAVARGAWLAPTLVVDEQAAAAQPAPLPEQVVADLHTAARLVVTDGTGSALRDLPGEPVHGKTGTAEAGEQTHAWFVGWQGDLALAVFVEDGDSGSGAAVPLADRFLRSLAD